MSYVQKGDVGVLIKCTVYASDGTTPYSLVNIDPISYTTHTLQIWASPPSGNVKTWDASKVNGSGADGQVQYTTLSSTDLDEAGQWNFQVYWAMDTVTVRHTTITSIDVYNNVA